MRASTGKWLIVAIPALLGVNAQVSIAPQVGVHVPGSVPENPYEPLQQRLAYAGPSGKFRDTLHIKYDQS